jgi:hypothetical protein
LLHGDTGCDFCYLGGTIRVDPAVEIADRAAVVTAAQVDGFADPLLLG